MGERVRITVTIDKEHKEFIQLYAKLKGNDTINNFIRKTMYAFMARYPILKSDYAQKVYKRLSYSEKRLFRKIEQGMDKMLTEWSLIKLMEHSKEVTK